MHYWLDLPEQKNVIIVHSFIQKRQKDFRIRIGEAEIDLSLSLALPREWLLRKLMRQIWLFLFLWIPIIFHISIFFHAKTFNSLRDQGSILNFRLAPILKTNRNKIHTWGSKMTATKLTTYNVLMTITTTTTIIRVNTQINSPKNINDINSFS